MVDEGAVGETSDNTREQGLEFGQLKQKLASHEYPATGQELLAAYGDAEIGLPDRTTTLRDVLGERVRERDESAELRYDSADEFRQSVFNMVGSDAIGRANYTDRGTANHDDFKDGESGDQESI